MASKAKAMDASALIALIASGQIDADMLREQTATLGVVLEREARGGDVRADLEGIWNLCHALLDAIEDDADLRRHSVER